MSTSNRYLDRLVANLEQDGSAIFCRMVGLAGVDEITWGDFRQDCCRFRDAYVSSGLRPGDLVLVFLRHVRELYGAFFGAQIGGFVPSFMPCASPRQDPKIYWSSHNELMQRIKPAAVVASRDTFKEMVDAGFDLGSARTIFLEEVRNSNVLQTEIDCSGIGEDTIGLLQHSSGTTGLKKGVALSFGAIANQADSYGRSLKLTDDDVIVSWLPLYHDMGLIACCVLPAYFNIPITHIDAFFWIGRPAVLFEHIQRDRGTLCWMPNFAYEHMANLLARRASSYVLSTLRALINCSEPCKASTFDKFAESFAASGLVKEQLQCCYAMAESVFAATQTEIGQLPHRVRVEQDSIARGQQLSIVKEGGLELIACGKPLGDIQIEVVDESRQVLPQPAVGELALSGTFLFSGYNQEPEKTSQQLHNGVYYTRDLGFIHDGHVFILGRLDDMIIVNGRNIYAHEVESVVSGIEGAKSGRTLAAPLFDERVGSNTLLIIAEKEPNLSVDEDTIRREIMEGIHSTFNVTPHKIRLVEAGWLIKTTSGKISRKANLQKYIEEAAGVSTHA
jgi:fatty-acyl-CoA synthase